MAFDAPTRTLDELARLGSEAVDRFVRPSLRPEDDRKFIAVDVNTGEFELDLDDFAAVSRLHSRVPNAEVWLAKVGSRAACRIGALR